MRKILLILCISMPALAMEMDLDPELLELPLSPRDKELADGPRSPRPLQTPVSSPRISSLSSPRRLSLANLLKGRRASLQKTFSSPTLHKTPTSPRPESQPTRKRLSSSSLPDAEREKVLILPPRPQKRVPISGEEDPDNFRMVVFSARNRVCSNALLKTMEKLDRAKNLGDQEAVKKFEKKANLLNQEVLEYAEEQRDWLVDQMLKDESI